MNRKLLFVTLMVTMLVMQPSEGGKVWDWIKSTAKKLWNSEPVKELKNTALNAAKNLVAEKIGATPSEAGQMPFDEFMDILYE
uniref:Opistoporin-1 n=1 Tax=Opistophthalmus carinatus TaxID=190115 RepID=NDB24_OPICA|nr:RecName: Full=Opistoporin-1; Short=OP1; AltName: Full=Non-disulfide-bridged peptide 2.4; Short=NDBP-2.4; AltName: Full=Non-disulfide-bridged peptide 3.5; Short=NDBP-3.5; AltName: Full=Opistoporin-3; Short=OP3; Flags: Precursor [Opistophthalmus carinatus]AAQ94362.1 Opistoporin3 preproprotein [Opistophthalmus carinatus]